MYSVATGLQYINTADDSRARAGQQSARQRGQQAGAEGLGQRGRARSRATSPIYAVSLYSDPTLKRPAGSGVYTCYFNYDQHALCKAYYKLKAGGTLVASGPVDFKASGFTIVITGGTNRYLGARGEVIVAAVKNASGRQEEGRAEGRLRG